MKTQESFIEALRKAAKRMKPLVASPVAAPLFVVLAGLILHGVFSVATNTQVIFGGPNDEVVEVVSVAQAAELIAQNQIGAEGDELDEEIGLILDAEDSLNAGAVSPFLFGADTGNQGAELHRVRPGETFYSVAELYGLTQKKLASANPEMSEPLIVGDSLVIPAAVTPASGNFTDNRWVSGSYLPAGFRWPAAGKIGPAHGRFDARDIPNALGTTIVAAGPGTVVSADYGWEGGYGNRVIIDHGNGLHTLYGHLNDLIVTIGQVVKEGEIIGFMGSTGRSTGPHVHFEVRWDQ